MSPKSSAPDLAPTWTPRLPTLTALLALTFWVVILGLPMFAGRFIVNPHSDQLWAGLPFRWFLADAWHRTGHIPLWNPYMFGGLPFVGAMHGDIFYPTAWLRMFLPIDTAMNLGFAGHVVLAGFFAYVFFRVMRLSWSASVVGGLAYQLSGIVASMVSPGHDGKLFVSAWMPMILTAAVVGIRDRRLWGYGVLALSVGLGLLTPHIQMMQYTLITLALFCLYLVFWSPERPATPGARWRALGWATAAVVLGFGIAMIQLYPFIRYMPYSARSAGAQGWEYATSYAMPWPHVIDWLVSDFTGILDHYSGENFIKYQSEYVGAAVLALASLGIARKDRRPLIRFFGGVALLFFLVCLGAHSPFYRLWYAVIPGAKAMRAPAMSFFIPTFAFALFAGLGVERIERGERSRLITALFVTAGVLLVLGASGALGDLAIALVPKTGPYGTPDQQHVAIAEANAGRVAASAVLAAAFIAAVAGAGLAAARGKLRGAALAGVLALLVSGDLFINVRRFWLYSPRASVLYADDPVTARLEATPKPYRVLNPFDFAEYPTAYLMAKDIPQVIGHHGNEMNDYDQLLGGKNIWHNLYPNQEEEGYPAARDLLDPPRNLYALLSVRFMILPESLPVPGFHLVTGPAPTTPTGRPALLYEADSTPPYARVVPAAAKIPDERIVPTLMDPRLDIDRLLLLPDTASIDVPRVTTMPEASGSRASVSHWEPGKMSVRLDPAPQAASFLMVSENWYPEWRATVDGRAVTPLRGDYTFLTVPVPAGARDVELAYSRDTYDVGKTITLASLAVSLVLLLLPMALRRRETPGG